MIDQKYLIANESSFPEGTDMSAQDVSQLEDSHSLVLLAGLKELAGIRGYAKIDYETITADKDYAAVKCTIIWTPTMKQA